MTKESVSALRVDMYDCIKETPAIILKPFTPENSINKAWIPQTMGDQIWVLYEFKTKKDREEWENMLPENISKWLDRGLIEVAQDYGWHIRNANGFY